MKRTVASLVFGAVVCAVLPTTNLLAQRNPVNRREHREQLRIRQGVRTGDLTRQEVRKLEREQARIRTAERRARADGEFTAKERIRIERRLNHASRDIFRQKHDKQDR